MKGYTLLKMGKKASLSLKALWQSFPIKTKQNKTIKKNLIVNFLASMLRSQELKPEAVKVAHHNHLLLFGYEILEQSRIVKGVTLEPQSTINDDALAVHKPGSIAG